MIINSGDMSCLSELVLQWYNFNVGDHDLFQIFNVCDEVTTANVEDGAEIELMKAHGETYVNAVGDSSLCTVKNPKILGLKFDPKLAYNSHIRKTSDKARNTLKLLKALTSTKWGNKKKQLS